MKIKNIERILVFSIGLISSLILNGQTHVGSTLNIGEIEKKPCLTYLNFLGLEYRPQMLKKDTLIFDYKDVMIIFIQNKKKLISARFIDKKTNLDFSKSYLENGTGKLIVFYYLMPRTDTSIYWLFNFKDGVLSDTTYFINSGKVKGIYVFENNDLRIVEKFDYSNINTIHSHQEYLYGLKHGKHKWYGLLGTSTIFLPYEWDKYDGKLFKEMIYDNGQLLEEIEYKKNGTKARHQKFQLHTKYPFVERKECE